MCQEKSHHQQKRAESAGDVPKKVTSPAERGQKCRWCAEKSHITRRKGPKVLEMCQEKSHHPQKRAESACGVPRKVTSPAEKDQKCRWCAKKSHITRRKGPKVPVMCRKKSHHPQEVAKSACDVPKKVTSPAEKGQKCWRCAKKSHITRRKGPKVPEMCQEKSHHPQKGTESAGGVLKKVTLPAEKGRKCRWCAEKSHITRTRNVEIVCLK